MFTFDDSPSGPPAGRPLSGPSPLPALPAPAAHGPDDSARATPIFHALLAEWRRMLRAVPGDRADEEYAALAARPQFAAMLPAQTGDRAGYSPLGGGRHRGAAAPAPGGGRPGGLSLVPVPQPGAPGHLPL